MQPNGKCATNEFTATYLRKLFFGKLLRQRTEEADALFRHLADDHEDILKQIIDVGRLENAIYASQAVFLLRQSQRRIERGRLAIPSNRNRYFLQVTIMSNSNERSEAKVPSAEPPLSSGPPANGSAGVPRAEPARQSTNDAVAATSENPGPTYDPREGLKRELEKTRLSPEVKAQILAEMPPPRRWNGCIGN
jgi:hypothetical protein